MVKIIRASVIGYVKVGPAVVIVIGPHTLHAKVVIGIVNAGLLRNILEGSITTIVKEEVRLSGKAPRSALHGNAAKAASLLIATEDRQLVHVHINVTGHEQVDLAVFVVIAPRRAGAETTDTNTGLLGYILKLAVAKTFVKNVAAVTGHVDV